MIHIRLPDGATRPLAPASTAVDLAASISLSLAKPTVAALVDGELADRSAPLPDGTVAELLARDDPRALELIHHDLAHVLAEAFQTLWPGTRTAIGSAIEHGFYYDFERDIPFTPDDRGENARDHRRAHPLQTSRPSRSAAMMWPRHRRCLRQRLWRCSRNRLNPRTKADQGNRRWRA